MELSNNELIIRKAPKEEWQQIVSFQLQMASETEGLNLNPGTVKAGVRHVFDHPQTGFYLMAYHERHAVASLMVLYEWSDWRNGNVAWIHSVYVIPDYRSKGVFKSMYLFLKEMVRKEDSLKGLRLYVDKANHRARRVYEKMGMSAEHYELFEWMQDF